MWELCFYDGEERLIFSYSGNLGRRYQPRPLDDADGISAPKRRKIDDGLDDEVASIRVPQRGHNNKPHSLTAGYDRPFSWTSLKTEELFSSGNPNSSSFFSSSAPSSGYRAGIEEEEVTVEDEDEDEDDGDGEDEGMHPEHAFTLARLEGRVLPRATSPPLVGWCGEVDVEFIGRFRRFTRLLDPRDENDGVSGDGEDVRSPLSLKGWTTGERDALALGRRERIGGWMKGAWRGQGGWCV